MMKNKSGFIISATSDIGEKIAIKFAQSGISTLYLHGRDKTHLTNIASECSKLGVKCSIFNYDLVDENQLQLMKDQLNNEILNETKLDYFVFCAGCCGDMDPIAFLRMEEDFLKVMKLNFLSCVDLFEFLIPKFSDNSSSIFITSTNTFIPLECGSAYSCSKCALKEYMESKALELGSKGIRVNSIAPGLVATKLHNQYFESEEELQEFFDKCKNEHPLGRIATVDGIANAALFLCSDLSNDITGTETVIDCGETLAIRDKPGSDSNSEYEEEFQ